MFANKKCYNGTENVRKQNLFQKETKNVSKETENVRK